MCDPDMEEQLARAHFEQLPSVEILCSRRLDALSYAWANLCIGVMVDPGGGIDADVVAKLFDKALDEYITRLHYGQRSRH